MPQSKLSVESLGWDVFYSFFVLQNNHNRWVSLAKNCNGYRILYDFLCRIMLVLCFLLYICF